MPSNSAGQIEIVSDCEAQSTFSFSTQDTIVHVSDIPTGGTILHLPSPLPTDGDRYEFADIDGSCGPGSPLAITDPNGHAIAGSATRMFTSPFSWGVVRFDAKSASWSLLSQASANTNAGIISVADNAALAAFPAAGLDLGSIAYVATYGAYFALSQTTAAVPDVVITATDGRSWTRTGPAQPSVALAQAFWQIDSVAGSNENPGTLANPVKDYAEIVRRWGNTTSPALTVNPTIAWTNADPADVVTLTPATGQATLQGRLVPFGAPLVLGTFTPKNRAAGTPATINVPAHVWTAGTIVHDSTANASFEIQADLGGGTAQITEPLSLPVGFGSARVLLANGDALQVFQPTTIVGNVLGNIPNAVTLQQLNVQAGSNFLVNTFECNVLECTFTNCLLNDSGSFFFGCWGASFFGGGVLSARNSTLWQAGALNGAGNNLGDLSAIDFDVLIPLRGHLSGAIVIGAAYFGQWFTDTGGTQNYANISCDGGVPAIWGPATIALTGTQQLFVRNGTAAAALLCTGGLTMNGLATAYSFDTVTGAFSAGPIALNPAAVDANGALVNPKFGTRFAVG